MTPEDFDALLARREELRADHERACAILVEEGSTHENLRECARRYNELTAVQAQIDAQLEAERALSQSKEE
jgi:hypothetical protein